MQGQRGQDFETAARGRHSFRFLGPRPNDRLSHPVKEAAYRAAIHLNPQRGVERLAHFLQAALGIALMRAPQERLRLGGEFATISLTPPVQETGEALGRQAGLVTKILWPTKGHRVSAEKLVHGQIGSSDLFYHRCDLLGSAFPAGRGHVHPPQHSLNMAIWPACSAVFVRSWGIKRYNWTMLFRGEDSSSSWLLIISSTDSFLRARESRSYVELRSGPVSANCNSPKYQTIVMYVLFFIHLETRRVNLAGFTPHPDQEWMEQQARNITMEEWGCLRGCRYLLHDRDAKFCQSFRELIKTGSLNPLRLPARSPNLNSYAER